jgi:anaerobic magnesium-protoporphyrin IX monomethyl ester cyclase
MKAFWLPTNNKRGFNKDVLLVFPGKYHAPNAQVPLSLLNIASSLIQSGFKTRLLDMRVEEYRTVMIGNPVFVGISAIHDSQIRYGLDFAKKTRTESPNVLIVWGGVHPSLLPEQTLASRYVDIVVRGEGESTVADLAHNLEAGEPLDAVKGISYKAEGEIKHNPDASLINLDSISINLPYELLKLDSYPTFKAGRFHIQTSRGCPHSCSYCYNSVFNRRRWRAKNPRRVLDEIEYIIEKFPNVKIIDPVDDNFFVDRKRVEDICRGMLERKINVKWRADCRFDYLSRYEGKFLELLQKAGCIELDFGGESGSERLQFLIGKDVTPDQMRTSVANLRKWAPNIEPYVSWMSGFPTETEEDLNKTFNLMDEMTQANPKTQHFGIFTYTPLSSNPLDTLLGPDFKPPQSLEEWGDVDVFHFSPSWHSKAYVKKLHAVSAVTKYAFYPQVRVREWSLAHRLSYGVLNKFAKFRWKHRFFRYPIEVRIADALTKKSRGYL